MARIAVFLRAAAAAAVLLFPAAAGAADMPENALMVVPSQTAFDAKFQDFLASNGAKLLRSYPPSVYIGYIPPALDRTLRARFDAEVYRGKVDDWSSFAQYGDQAVYAVNEWNKRFMEDPPEAPLVVSARVEKAARRGDGIKLVWNDIMRAVAYRLQISTDQSFRSAGLGTVTAGSGYVVYPAFFREGIYYWRVAGIIAGKTGGTSEGPFSAAYSFAIPGRAARRRLPARPRLPAALAPVRKLLRWPGTARARYYQLQLSEKRGFEATLVDVFTDTCSYDLSGLPLLPDTVYYLRVRGGAEKPGPWSRVSRLKLPFSSGRLGVTDVDEK